MQYKIIVVRVIPHTTDEIDDAIVKLEKKVNEEIANGWRPQGGVNVDSIVGSNIYVITQAMVKED